MLKEVFQVYLNRLVDLSSKNRSLYLSKIIPSQMVNLNELDFLNHHSSFRYIEELLGNELLIPLIPTSDPRDSHVNIFSKRLNRIQSLAQTAEHETGEQSTFLAWPYVEGKLINGQIIRCPLIFFPVTLLIEDNKWKLKRTKSDLPFFNKTFLLAYEQAYGKKRSKEVFDFLIEDFPKDAVGFLNSLYDFIKEELQINFTTALYEKKILDFPESNKSLDDSRLKLGELKLKAYAILGLFSQKTGFLIQDYEQLIADENEISLEALFQKKFAPRDYQIKPIREDQLYNCFPVDAYQEEVIKAVRTGKSVVVEGPPGTGKSQLISNLALDYIARGKKVLVVSQKRAALDVVYQRLADLGFDMFLALVHDFRADRSTLFKKIQGQIDSLDNYKSQNQSIDAIQLERQFFQVSKTIENQVEFFDDFKKALFNTEECEIPIKELYLESKQGEEHFDMTQYYKRFPFERVPVFLRNLKVYSYYYDKYQIQDSFWLHRVSFSLFSASSQERLEEVFDEIRAVKSKITRHFEPSQLFDISFFYSLYEQKSKVKQLSECFNQEGIEVFEKIIDTNPEQIDLLWLEQKFETIQTLLSEFGVEWYSSDEEVENYLTLSITYKDRGKGILDRLLWPIKKKQFIPLFELLEKNSLSIDKYGNESLLKKLENRLNLNHQITLLSKKDWLKIPKKPFSFPEFRHFAQGSLAAINAKLILHEFGQMGNFLIEGVKEGNLSIVKSKLQKLLKEFEYLDNRFPHWSLFLSKIQIQHLFLDCSDQGFEKLKNESKFIFDDLVAFDSLKEELSPKDVYLMEKLRNKYSSETFDILQKRFLAGLRLAWIAHIEKKYPVLKEISTPKTGLVQEELIAAILAKWDLSKFISGLRLREYTLKDLKYNRLGNLVSFRELSHQVKKKRGLWSIKKMLENFEADIFQLMPCWLASPETVSALFPLKASFDLVIFDEASQCFVERGLPAMLRGKQVLVAGDSQQLQPFDLYETRFETEEEGVDFEIDSLLDISSMYFEKFWLQGHYRSEQLSLIEFSNTFFYEDKLSMLPNRNLVNQPAMPYKLIKVEGVWDHQINIEEADAVIHEVKSIQQAHPFDSIGIITFNYFQMEFIKEKLQGDLQIELKNLTVKNIENVQGDEFDRVIFSIGYAKNKSGRFISNFGMLSKKGGSNRLNVAVSRSRKSISLVTSLNSRDFKPSQLKNPGIEMLKNYLDFVERKVSGKNPQKEVLITKGYQQNWYLKNKLIEQNGGSDLVFFSDSKWMDLAIVKDNQFQLALLTDDDRMYMAKGAKEAFAYHPIQLQQKNWPFFIYFSRQYWMGKIPFLQRS